MADQITASDAGAKFSPHPAGQFGLVCVDTIDLGLRVKAYPGSPTTLSKACALVFWSGEKNEQAGTMHEVSAEFTVSMNEKAKLRKFLEDWRGRSYTNAEAQAGVPLDKLVGAPALGAIEHKESKAGRSYATLKAIQPLPKGMPKPDVDLATYVRGEYWEKRKAAYAAEVATYRGQSAGGFDATKAPPHNFDDFPAALEDPEDDDLPF